MSEVYEIWGGDVEVRLTGEHIYYIDRAPGFDFPRQVYGASSVAKVLTMPDPLIWWAVGCAATELSRRFEQAREHYWKMEARSGMEGHPDDVPVLELDEVTENEWCKAIKFAHRSVSDNAAALGTAVHKWVAAKLSGESPYPLAHVEARKHCEAFLAWAQKVGLKPLETERPVCSMRHGFAGTTDMVAMVEGRPAILDIKVSTGIYDGVYVQTAGYRIAYREEQNYLGDRSYDDMDRWAVLFNKKSGRVETRRLPDHGRDEAAFLNALALYKWVNWRKDGCPEKHHTDWPEVARGSLEKA